MGFALGALAVKAPPNIDLYVAGQGAVNFDHQLHQGMVKGCKKCHHFGVGNGSCDGCHGVAPQAPALADALAKSCAKCHSGTSVSSPTEQTEPELSRKELRRQRLQELREKRRLERQ